MGIGVCRLALFQRGAIKESMMINFIASTHNTNVLKSYLNSAYWS